MGKRKRIRSSHLNEGCIKRQKIRNSDESDPVIKQAVLAQYYPQVLSLREYLLSKLPETSKIRKKKISSVGKRTDDSEDNRRVSEFLDRTLVGVSKCTDFSSNERWQHRSTFTQRADDSVSCANPAAAPMFSQSEVNIIHSRLCRNASLTSIRLWITQYGCSSLNLARNITNTFYVKDSGKTLAPILRKKM